MGNQEVSRFEDKEEWVVLSKKGKKEIMQSKKTKETIEKYTLEDVEREEMKSESMIYEWRASKKTSKFAVEIQEMKYLQSEDKNCWTLCNKGEEPHKLVLYSEHIHKLYQNNNKFTFKKSEQTQLFFQIIEAIDFLSHKFGFFMISKEMIGYNSKQEGKAWINENYASNFVQYKRQISDKTEKQKWESSIVDTMIDTCRLCTTQINSKDNKFSHIINIIKRNGLSTFDMIRGYRKKMRREALESSEAEERKNSEEKSNKVKSIERSESKIGANSNSKDVISSTKDCKVNNISQEKKYALVPVVNVKKIYKVSEQERLHLENHIRNSEHISYRNSTMMQSPPRQNYVQTQRHSHSFISSIRHNHYAKSEISKPLYSIMEHPPRKRVQEYNDGRYLKEESAASPMEEIQMIDSMIVLENDIEESFQRNGKVVLEESIIVRGFQKQ